MSADTERQIIDLLHQNARHSHAQIATMLGLEEAAVAAAIADLEARGVIRRYMALIDREKAGETAVEAFIDVHVQPQRGVGFDHIAERIYRFPEVVSCVLMSGAYDLSVQVRAKDLMQVARFVSERLSVIEGVSATATHFVLKRYKIDGVILTDTDGDERLAVTP